jgi:hypothetical protein
VLGVKTERGDAGMALRPDWEPAVRATDSLELTGRRSG